MKVSIDMEILREYLPESEFAKITKAIDKKREIHKNYMQQKREIHKNGCDNHTEKCDSHIAETCEIHKNGCDNHTEKCDNHIQESGEICSKTAFLAEKCDNHVSRGGGKGGIVFK